MSARRSALLLLLVSPLAVAAPTRAAPDEPQLAARQRGPGAPAVWRDSDGWRLEVAGRATRLPAATGDQITSVASLADGWLAAGFRPAAAGSELVLLRGSGDKVAAIAPPPGATASYRLWPVLVADGSQPVGLAWLEGEESRSYAVRWSPWTGAGFAPPVEIAPPGPGSQLALAAARLEDGRTLLVWAAYDGTDDEIVAAVGAGREWSTPIPVGRGNDVPDITPDVVAIPGGALVAWSRFDEGEYRIALARYADGHFAELAAAGPPGSLFPTFESGDGDPVLLWHDARSDSWVLAELKGDAALLERARVAGDDDWRPLGSVRGRAAELRFGDGVRRFSWE